jgi:predicted DNA-binding ribbon-helix-helix protein
MRKHPFDMSAREYGRLVRKVERGVPASAKRITMPREFRTTRLTVRSFKISVAEWNELKRVAKHQGVTASSLMRKLAKNAGSIVLVP